MDESAIYSAPFCADHAREQNNQMFENRDEDFQIEIIITGLDGGHCAQLEAKQMQKG